MPQWSNQQIAVSAQRFRDIKMKPQGNVLNVLQTEIIDTKLKILIHNKYLDTQVFYHVEVEYYQPF